MKRLYPLSFPLFTSLFFFLLVYAAGSEAAAKGNVIRIALEADLDEFVRGESNDPADVSLNKALSAAHETGIASEAGFIKTFVICLKKNNIGRKPAALFVQPYQQDITANSTDDELIAALNKHLIKTLQRTVEILKGRVGKAWPDSIDVQLDEKQGLVLVDVAGGDINRIRRIVTDRGNMYFYETYTNPEFIPYWIKADETLADVLNANTIKGTATKKTKAPTMIQKPRTGQNPDKESDEDILKKHPLFAILSPNVTSDRDAAAPGPVVGFVFARDTEKLRSYLEMKTVRDLLPVNVRFLYAVTNKQNNLTEPLQMYAVKVPDKGTIVLNSSYIIKATTSENQYSNSPCVTMEMSLQGAYKWRDMTKRNIGAYIAVAYNDAVYSCPRVMSAIESGFTEICGSFSGEETDDLARILTAGKLPLSMYIVKEGFKQTQ